MYLNDGSRNQNDFYQLRKTMFIDDRIMNNKKEGGHMAVILYMAFEDKISLSKSKHLNGNNANYINAYGQYFCCLSEKDAKQELRMTSGVYKDRKAFLKKIGLIDYSEQAEKKDGVASQITYTPWDIWVEQNGLYSDGEWIIEPTREDFYNPTDIVKIQPNIAEPKQVEEPKVPVEKTAQEIHDEEQRLKHEQLQAEGKKYATKLVNVGRKDEVIVATKKYFKGKLFKEATTSIEDMLNMELAIKEYKRICHTHGLY